MQTLHVVNERRCCGIIVGIRYLSHESIFQRLTFPSSSSDRNTVLQTEHVSLSPLRDDSWSALVVECAPWALKFGGIQRQIEPDTTEVTRGDCTHQRLQVNSAL